MTDAELHHNRRAHERRALHGAAEICPAQGHPIPVPIIDISVGGMRVLAPINPREGTPFLLRTRLPLRPFGSLLVEVKVRVAYSILTGGADGFTVGLNFLNLPDEAEQAICGYLDV